MLARETRLKKLRCEFNRPGAVKYSRSGPVRGLLTAHAARTTQGAQSGGVHQPGLSLSAAQSVYHAFRSALQQGGVLVGKLAPATDVGVDSEIKIGESGQAFVVDIKAT